MKSTQWPIIRIRNIRKQIYLVFSIYNGVSKNSNNIIFLRFFFPSYSVFVLHIAKKNNSISFIKIKKEFDIENGLLIFIFDLNLNFSNYRSGSMDVSKRFFFLFIHITIIFFAFFTISLWKHQLDFIFEKWKKKFILDNQQFN